MRRILLGTVLAAFAALLIAPSASAQAAPTTGGCAAFGTNVALLGQSLGSVFGQTASSTATSGPRALPANVVFPEQESLCGTGA